MGRIVVAAVVLLGLTAGSPSLGGTPMPDDRTKILEHGGGCRKSSPPGQCCHMDHSTGVVHCH